MTGYDRILVFEDGLLLRVGAILCAQEFPELEIFHVKTQARQIDISGDDRLLIVKAMRLANFTYLDQYWINPRAVDTVSVEHTTETKDVKSELVLIFHFPGDIELVIQGTPAELFMKIQSEMP